jgi:hypothetical protein
MSNVTPYLSPVPIAQLSHLLDINLSTPQSYGDLNHSSNWREAVSLAALLHASVTVRPSEQRNAPAAVITLPQETLALFSRV